MKNLFNETYICYRFLKQISIIIFIDLVYVVRSIRPPIAVLFKIRPLDSPFSPTFSSSSVSWFLFSQAREMCVSLSNVPLRHLMSKGQWSSSISRSALDGYTRSSCWYSSGRGISRRLRALRRSAESLSRSSVAVESMDEWSDSDGECGSFS